MNKTIKSKILAHKSLFLGKKDELIENFNLIEVQKNSWTEFTDIRLKEIFNEFFPIDDYTKKKFTIYFEDLYFGKTRYTIDLCLQKKLTFDAPVYLKLRLVNKKTNSEKKQDIYFFNLPRMTDRGTFIINGIERAIINQIVRSPGVYFTAEIDKTTGLTLYNAEIRPYIGAWLDLTINKHGLIEMKINKKRKFLSTVFLKVFENDSEDDIINYFNDIDKSLVEKYLLPTLKKHQTKNKDQAVLEIYRKIRPGEPLILENAYETINNLLFNQKRYSLADVGRYKINKKLAVNLEIKKENRLLTKIDIIATIKYLLTLTKNKGDFDDIDHLGNRRLRTVGELISLYGIRVGMVRVEREIKERMSLISGEELNVAPSQVVNSKPLIVAINSFYRTSQLSTIVDQTNPLSELDNLRRITVGGHGGIEKERASFSIRDISSSQYGRICPIRSPEGPNIGVVTYMALYTRVNKYGFLETPYRKLLKEKRGDKTKVKVSNEIIYLQADNEEQYYITSNNINIDKNNYVVDQHVVCRYGGEIVEVAADKLDLIDVSPRQIIGASAALIPLLQNDDASRALMGTHMQCQAVPLIKPRAPIVGTGLEKKVSSALNRTITASEDGLIVYVDANKVVMKGKTGKEYTYILGRFVKTNKDVVFDQKPRVGPGEKVKKGQVIIDGPSTDKGELALGQNLVQ